MNNFQKVWNEYTNKYDLQSTVKLVNVADQPMPNKVTGKMFYPASVEYTDPNGKKVESQAIIYAKNYDKGMETGKNYLATFIQTDQGVLITVSPLTQAPRPDAKAFESLFAKANAEAPAVTKQVADGQVA